MRLATITGVVIAAGALLLLAIHSAPTSAARSDHPEVLAKTDPSCSTGDTPLMPGYDPVTHEIYVPNFGIFGTSSISVFDKTCNLVGTIPLAEGSWPFQAAFDPGDNDMYVTDFGANEINVVYGTTIVANITGFDEPEGIAYDQSDLVMAVVNHGNSQVDFIVGTYVSLGFYTGANPYEIVYDYYCVCDTVTNEGSNNLTVYETRLASTFSVGVGTEPTGISYDFWDGYVYVANTGSNNVSVLVNDVVQYSINGFDEPGAIAFDQATLHVYVTNQGNGTVIAISTHYIVKHESTASGSGADGIAYDEFDNKMYVTGASNDELYVLT